MTCNVANQICGSKVSKLGPKGQNETELKEKGVQSAAPYYNYSVCQAKMASQPDEASGMHFHQSVALIR